MLDGETWGSSSRTDSGLLRTDLEKTFERAQRHANVEGQIDRRSTRDLVMTLD
jgi:hypothetical protein